MYLITISIFLWRPGTVEMLRGDHPPTKVGNYKKINKRDGRIDQNGNFVPYIDTKLRSTWYVWGGAGRDIYTVNEGHESDTFRECYEHRSEAVILGTWGAVTQSRVFVPKEGSVITRFKDVLKDNHSGRMIYNFSQRTLIGDTKLLPQDDIRVNITKKADPIGPPPGYEFLSFEKYDAQIDVVSERRFVRVIGGVCEIGQLDGNGEFVPDYGLPVMEFGPPTKIAADLRHLRLWIPPKDKERIRNFGDKTDYPNYTYTLPLYGEKSEQCYEYRSGRL
ncbi:MAG: hypothetical protein ACRCZF_24860, partial [Gemmataceae bacterium]